MRCFDVLKIDERIKAVSPGWAKQFFLRQYKTPFLSLIFINEMDILFLKKKSMAGSKTVEKMNWKKNEMKRNRAGVGLWLMRGLTVLYGAACLYLYYMQSIQPLDYDNRHFQSDLPYHISMIVEDGWYYSFTAYVYQALYYLCGKTTVGIAVFLAAVTVASLLLTELLLRRLADLRDINWATMAAALILNLMMPFYLKWAGSYRYVSYQSGNLWHNSTYLCMRLMALAALLYYGKLEQNYREKITAGQWGGFALLLVICTGVKPSFLTVFAPALALKLLWDLWHGTRFRQVFLLGSAVLPACGVVLWQNMVLFGADTGNGMTFAPWYTFSLHADRPKLAVLCSLAFPLTVLGASLLAAPCPAESRRSGNMWHLRLRRAYLFSLLMALVGFAEALCLTETGGRSRDGNFLWGYLFAIFWLQAVSLVKWLSLRNVDSMLLSTGENSLGRVRLALIRTAYILAGLVLLYQLWCGGYFFFRLLRGETYFMMG